MKVLVLSSFYEPAFRAGGPIRTLANMADLLGDKVTFRVLTTNRDLATEEHLPVPVNCWTQRGRAEVCYLTTENCRSRAFARQIAATEHDVLYLNSFFAARFAVQPLWLRRWHRIPRRPVVLAPRGEFDAGALGVGNWFKRLKKRVYIRCTKLFGLCRDVLWQASSEFEAEAIRHIYPKARVHVAPDLADSIEAPARREPKNPGAARFIFFARISPKKGLDIALRCLANVRGQAQFDIYGPIDDENYWKECQSIMGRLPQHVCVRYRGVVDRQGVADAFAGADFFLMPTHGENFGHSIIEAMAFGCPVLISDRTPWRELIQHRAGWDLPLEDPNVWVRVLDECIAMESAAFADLSSGTQAFARNNVNSAEAIKQNMELFKTARDCAADR